MSDNKTLVLIDGHALAFRMFFALERTNMQTTEHEPTWAVYGFFKAVFDILRNKQIKPNALAVAFDVSKKTFRLEKYDQYKANRLAMPDSLRPQLGLIMEGLKALNIPIYTKEGFEGDDIIGTIATNGIKEGYKTYILTGDKDSYQLINKENDVCVLIPSKGELVFYDWDAVFEKMGVYPNQIVDYKALCGDKSDNIPGVKGVGPKTACSLLNAYKTLDNVYANIENISGATKTKLEENKETAYLSQFLATIERNVEIDFNYKNACLNLPNKDKLIEFFQRVQFFGFIKNIDKILERFSSSDVEICDENENIVKFKEVEEIKEGYQFGIFNSLAPKKEDIISDFKELSKEEFLKNTKDNKISMFLTGDSAYFAGGSYTCKINNDDLKDVIENENIKKIVFGIKNVIDIHPNIKGIKEDLSLSSYVKDPSRKHDLISQIQNYLGIVTSEMEEVRNLAIYMLKLSEYYEKNLDKDEKKLLSEIEIPLSFVLRDMEKRGVSIDVPYLCEISNFVKEQMKFYANKIYETAGCEFNINSPKQVSEILFEKLEIKPKKKNKGTKSFSTSAKVLEELALEYEIANDIIQFRQLNKLLTTYIDVLPKLVAEDNRVHTHYNQIVTNTGRLSSSDPNLQSIPIRTEIGNKIRKAFVPRDKENYLILSADYSQIELRLMAHFSEDNNLIDAFKKDVDVHTLTASRIFDVDMNDVTKDMRRKAKAVNFGIIYGQTRWGLASSLSISALEAQDFISKYFKTYPKISMYMNEIIAQAHQEGYVQTLFGRKRYLRDELNSRNANIREFAERAAINAPLQGSAADLIKVAMINLDEKLKPMKSKLIMQVHDELVLEVHKDELEDVKKYVLDSMELGQPLRVPLVVDVHVGNSWKDEE